MFTKFTVGAVALVIALGVGPVAVRADDGGYDFKIIDPPAGMGQLGVDLNITWLLINNNGLTAVQYDAYGDNGTHRHSAIIQKDGSWKSIDVPGSSDTGVAYPNEKGELGLAYLIDGQFPWHNTIYRNGQYTYLPDFPGYAHGGIIQSINNRGVIAAVVEDETGFEWGWVGSATQGTIFAYPPGPPDVPYTYPLAINDHNVAAGQCWFAAGGAAALRYENGVVTDITPPNSPGAIAFGINNRGTITGTYVTADGVLSGFILDKGKYTDFNVPGFTNVYIQPQAITDNGKISGVFPDYDGAWHGFIATPKQKKK